MMTTNTHKAWDNPYNFEHYEQGRKWFRPATAQVVRAVLEESLGDNDRVLEIGAGMGELVSLVPEREGQILQTEQSGKIIEQHKAKRPNSNIIQANVYELPFGDNSYDVVIGLSVLDTLLNMQSALGEIRRVLRPHGRLIHFLDLMASLNPFFDETQLSGLVPVPLVEDHKFVGIYKVSKSDLLSARIPQHLINLIERYIDDPLLYTEILLRDSQPVLLEDLSSLAKSIKGSSRDCIYFNKEFYRRLGVALKENHFKSLMSGIKTGRVDQTTLPLSIPPSANAITNTVGVMFHRTERSVPPSHLRTISNIHVAVAQLI